MKGCKKNRRFWTNCPGNAILVILERNRDNWDGKAVFIWK